jgi:phosphopentomutase
VFVTIILDGVGIGSAPDAAAYGDEGAHTLACVCSTGRPELPHLRRLGLGNLVDVDGLRPVADPGASFGSMEEVSAGKDSTSGHWELAGLHLEKPFPTYPEGFPEDVVSAFLEICERPGVLANRPASGTEVIAEYGQEHLDSGRPILYTSADSVFQVATHVDVVPLETLYEWCRAARDRVCVGDHAVGRVIARPFTGPPGRFQRVSHARRDYSLSPSSATIQERLQVEGVRTVAIGKIGDLFADVGFDEIRKTTSNAQGIEETLSAIREGDDRTFIWTNLVDFDQLFGHRNDPDGFARALEEFDRALPDLVAALPPSARLAVTSDHGNDPCFPGTDHTRERVPLLLMTRDGVNGRDLGIRKTFADHAASVARHFGVRYDGPGQPFI